MPVIARGDQRPVEDPRLATVVWSSAIDERGRPGRERGDDAVCRRLRDPEDRSKLANKQKPWARSADDGASVLRLPLDVSDPMQRARIEAMFEGAYVLRRALQRDARHRARAFWSAQHERAQGPAATRERLGLSRDALEDAAYAHLDAAPHLRRRVTKALAMHLADSVWTATERHLFADAKGKRHGMPRVGRLRDSS